ncbi:hypothetical protein NLI96_g11918 [Meripilus lineatus]|uniref:Uncharacterized protein n=1 Tax=Meripilus lineatus TaxID=2056292 RepID=A0AAD5USB8_9APHY|nr:hypothetical protein NLI96_g11918 [Physisporinus lineatus]
MSSPPASSSPRPATPHLSDGTPELSEPSSSANPSSSTNPSSSAKTSSSLSQKQKDLRVILKVPLGILKKIMQSKFYLGNPAIRSPAYTRWHSNKGVNILTLIPAKSDSNRLKIKELCVEFPSEIHPDASFLTVCGGYLTPEEKIERNMRPYDSDFHKTKASAILTYPVNFPDFPKKAWNNLIAAAREIQKLGIGSESGVIPAKYAKWPRYCKNPGAKIEMRKILADPNYEPVPLPAYDINGVLIPPAQYETKLYGATVHVKAVIVHQFFKTHNSHNYFLDIRSLNVIREPSAMASSDEDDNSVLLPHLRKLPLSQSTPERSKPRIAGNQGSPSRSISKLPH